MIARKYGHIRDDNRRRSPSLMKLVKATTLPTTVDLSKYVEAIHDQGQVSCCVGMATARAIDMRAKIVGISNEPYPSELGIYAIARIVARRNAKQALVDEGCMPADAAQGIALWGIEPEGAWPFDEAAVNLVPPLDVFIKSAAYHVQGFYAIESTGDQLCADIRQALAAGYPISFGQQVDQKFEDYVSGVMGPNTGPSLGGHMTNIVGYEPGNVFICLNSWGPAWGDVGFYRCSAERITTDAYDFYAAHVAPDMQEAA